MGGLGNDKLFGEEGNDTLISIEKDSASPSCKSLRRKKIPLKVAVTQGNLVKELELFYTMAMEKMNWLPLFAAKLT